MGLIKAAFGAAGGVMADQWKEFFYCEAIPADVLAVKGKKKVVLCRCWTLIVRFAVCCFRGPKPAKQCR